MPTKGKYVNRRPGGLRVVGATVINVILDYFSREGQTKVKLGNIEHWWSCKTSITTKV